MIMIQTEVGNCSADWCLSPWPPWGLEGGLGTFPREENGRIVQAVLSPLVKW